MKKLQHIILSLALLLAGCEDPLEADKALIESFDHTLPAYVMMSHSMKAIAAVSGTIIHACNLNEWLTAESHEARLAVEDKYYPYLKVREVQENLWRVYSQTYTEEFYLKDGLTLNQEGSVWNVLRDPDFFNIDTGGDITITRNSHDNFTVAAKNAQAKFYGEPQKGLYDYLSQRGGSYGEMVNITLNIQTNDSAFRNGEAEALRFEIEGEGTISSSGYRLHFSIDEPITMQFGTNGYILKESVGIGKMSITNTSDSERVRATFSPHNAIVIEYKTRGGDTLTGYYDWSGENITPR